MILVFGDIEEFKYLLRFDKMQENVRINIDIG